jgi:hypothetical protein
MCRRNINSVRIRSASEDLTNDGLTLIGNILWLVTCLLGVLHDGSCSRRKILFVLCGGGDLLGWLR